MKKYIVCKGPRLETVSRAVAVALNALLFFGLVFVCSSVSAAGATVKSFDAPGAGTGGGQGTWSVAINAAGEITGYYVDANNVAHGFVRRPNGSFETFDAPGAGNTRSLGTYAFAINLAGEVTGYYSDSLGQIHGFVRAHDGSIVVFDAPDASVGTMPSGINAEGVVTGFFYNGISVGHGFLRSRNGAITVLNDPQAGTNALGTGAVAVDAFGTVVGCYEDASFNEIDFVRTSDGTFTTLNPPGGSAGPGAMVYYFRGCVGSAFSVLQGVAISPIGGLIAGTYYERTTEPIQPGKPFGGLYRGFLRVARFGLFGHPPVVNYFTFDAVPSPSNPCCTWTFPLSVNVEGKIAGFYDGIDNLYHAFLRSADGRITQIDVPGSVGSVAASINDSGVITGYYDDINSAAHGFIWRP